MLLISAEVFKSMKFRNQYERIAQNLLERDVIKADGIPESTIIQFEIENNLDLPYALREYYSLLGNLDSINRANERLQYLNEIEIEANKLIFMLENQGVCYWAIDLGNLQTENPPIYVGIDVCNSSEMYVIEWNLETLKCFDFLVAMFYWQAASGGLPYGGIASINELSLK